MRDTKTRPDAVIIRSDVDRHVLGIVRPCGGGYLAVDVYGEEEVASLEEGISWIETRHPSELREPDAVR